MLTPSGGTPPGDDGTLTPAPVRARQEAASYPPEQPEPKSSPGGVVLSTRVAAWRP